MADDGFARATAVDESGLRLCGDFVGAVRSISRTIV
jgi:hypothetical protein